MDRKTVNCPSGRLNYKKIKYMKNKYLIPLLGILFTFSLSCQRLPEPDFSVVPEENPEAGDSIVFINSSADADSYEWEFGDGGTSSQESPVYIYEQAGIYNVKLTAYNKAGEESASRALTIFEPTVLGFFVYDSTGEIVLEDAQVWVYDNEDDWNWFSEPQMIGTTDHTGLAVFMNVDPLVYYIWVVKEETNGFWASGGYTSEVVLNENNYYNVFCTWLDYEKKTSAGHRELLRKIFSPVPRQFRAVMIPGRPPGD